MEYFKLIINSLLVFFTILFHVNPLFSQRLGLKAGINYSNFGKSYYKGYVGPTFGSLYIQPLGRYLITIEPSYSAKGYTYGFSKYKFSYLEAPITLGWFLVNKDLKITMNIGCAPALLYKREIISEGSKFVSSSRVIYDLDFIAGFKGGVQLNDRTSIFLNLRFGNNLIGMPMGFKNYYICSFIDIQYSLSN